MVDKEVIASILAGGKDREIGLCAFYRQNLKFIKVMQRKYGLSQEDLLDAYSDSIINFRDQIVGNYFQGKSKCSTYLFRIFQNKCIDILRKNTTKLIQTEFPEQIQDRSEDIVQKLSVSTKKEYLYKLIDRLSSKCKEILMDWNDGYTMEEIARRNDLRNAHVARSKRYSCLQQLLKLVKDSRVLSVS